ncbi:hypothetical protein pb186bvf_009835 [Paramecium bursaria]
MQRLDSRQQQTQPRQTTANAVRAPTRMATALRTDPNFQSVAQTTNLKFADRPVTQHGVQGVKPTTAGPGRQIQDRSYHLNILRIKQEDILKEIERFKKQSEQMTKDNSLFGQLEKRHDELTREVRDLEGQLADYNLAFDKFRANTRPEDIRNIHERIKIQNDRQRSQLDDIFIERKQQEDQITQIEQKLNDLNQMAELKLNELDPEQRNEYMGLINENKQLQTDIINQKNELDELNIRMQNADNRLRMDAQKLKGQMLKEQLIEMDQKKQDLELQLNEANLSFPEARDKLLARIKDDNAYIQNAEKKVREIRRNIENYEKRLRELVVEAEDKKSQESDKQKYEILYQRDQEMTEYIKNFDKLRSQELDKIEALEGTIVELLQEASKIAFSIKQVPQLTDFKDLQDELESKNQQKEDSEMTLKKAQYLQEQTQQDLKKLLDAEVNLPKEYDALENKYNNMQDEIHNKFNNIEKQKEIAEQKKQKLKKQKDELLSLRDQLNNKVSEVTMQYDKNENKLAFHEQYNTLTDLEKRVSQMESQANTFQIFIETKSKDMNYEQQKNECLDAIQKINKLLAK